MSSVNRPGAQRDATPAHADGKQPDTGDQRQSTAAQAQSPAAPPAQSLTIADQFPVLIVQFDRHARYRFVNEPYARRLGLRPDEVVGKTPAEVVGEAAFASVRHHVEAALRGERVEFEQVVPYPFGDRRMHAVCVPELAASGEVTGFVAVIQDVSHRAVAREREKSLVERADAATAKFEALFHQSGIFAGIMNLHGVVLEVNDLAVNACGYTREQVLGQPFWETPWWRGSEDVKQRIRVATQQAASGAVFREVLRYWVADGSERTVDFAMQPIRDAAGAVAFLNPTGIDITERTIAEEALRTQIERAALLSRTLEDLLAAKDPDAIVRDLFPRVGAHVRADVFFNFMVDERGDSLLLHACAGIPEESAREIRRLEFGQGLCGRVAARRLPFHATDIQNSRDDAGRVVRSLGIQAYFCNPLLVGDQLLGTLSFASRARTRFDPGELEFLTTVSQYVAIAMHRLRSEAALRERENQLRIITDAIPALVSYIDAGGRYRFANRQYSEWFGREHANILGESPEAVLGDDAMRVLRPRMDAAVRGEPTRFESEVPYRHGGTRWIDAQYVPDRAPDGTVRGFFVLVLDITERKLAEEALRQSEEKFRTLADNMSQFAWMADEKGSVFWYNRRWYEYTGTTLEQAKGWGWRSVHHPDHVDRVVARVQRSWDTGEVWEDTFPLRAADGRYRWFLSRAVPIRDADGNILRWLGTNTDITDQRRVEEELVLHRERLEQLVEERSAALRESLGRLRLSERMASLGTLAAGLGHDMGNLLVPVRVSLETLERMGLPEAARSELDGIKASAGYLQKLASGLRLLATDSAKGPRVETCELRAFWAEAQPVLKNILPRGVALAGEFPDEACWISIARSALTQAVFNLVQNAGDAMRASARGTVNVWAKRSGDRVLVGVTDSGPGMTDEVKRRCMEPFFTTKSRGISTGLGLSLVYGIAQEAGASVELTSEPGHGTSFVLSFAAAQPPDASNTPRAGLALVDIKDPRTRAYVAAELMALKYDVRHDAKPPDAPQPPHVDLAVIDEPRTGVAATKVVTIAPKARFTEIRATLREALGHGPSS